MGDFFYTSRLASGERREGIIQADNLSAARWLLTEQGLILEQLQQATDAQRESLKGENDFVSRILNFQGIGGAKSIHIELTLKQLSIMLRSGLSLLAALETVIEMPPSNAVRKLYLRIRARVEGGSTLSDAFDEHKVFPKSVVSMIGLGEESGNLDVVMRRSAEAMERFRRNRNAILSALAYPTLVVLFAIGLSAYMVVYVIPLLREALEALGRPLPPLTQSLLDLSYFIVTYGPGIAAILAILTVTFVFILFWPPGRLAVDRFLLRLPLVGTILRSGGTALFARALATLLESGIRLVEGLRILATVHGNRYFAAVVDSARNRVLEGGTLAESLGRGNAYMPMMIKMVGVGESSGNLEETLVNVADFHEEQLQTLISRLSAVMVPAVILVAGGIVFYVYLAFFLALYGAA
ncbi:MAG: type II secretion system F family protein [Verrucomicrobiota bacterium]